MTTTTDPPGHELPPEDESGVARAYPDADGADETYNLAARVYGDGHANDNGDGDANGDVQTDEAAPYNLAARVYGDGHPNGGSGRSNGDVPYNLASRVHGDGHANGNAAVDGANGNGHANGNGALIGGNGAAVASAVAVVPPAAPPAAPPPQAGEPPQRGRKISLRTFDSFNVVGYRWFVLAMLGQMASMNMQMLVRGFLVFELTGSFAALGTMSLGNAIPGLMFALFGGVIADRLQKKAVLQVGQLVNAMNAVVVGMLLLFGMLRFEHLLVSAVVQGTVMALMMPSRQSMIPEIVGPQRLMNAVALNTAGMNLMRLTVPALGGIMLAAADAFYVYFLMTGLYLFAVITLTKVPSRRPPERSAAAAPAGAAVPAGGGRMGMRGGRGRGAGSFKDVVDGVVYIAHNRTVLTLLVANFFIVLTSMPYMMMLPGFVKEVLDGGAAKLGLLISITGIGSLAGSLVIASMPPKHRGKILLLGSGLLGVALIGFSLSNVFWLTAIIMVFIGLGQTTRMSLSNVLLQAYVEDEYRGRVMSIYMMEFSLMQFGVFAVGILASAIGIQYALTFTSVLLLVFIAYAWLFIPRLRELD